MNFCPSSHAIDEHDGANLPEGRRQSASVFLPSSMLQSPNSNLVQLRGWHFLPLPGWLLLPRPHSSSGGSTPGEEDWEHRDLCILAPARLTGRERQAEKTRSNWSTWCLAQNTWVYSLREGPLSLLPTWDQWLWYFTQRVKINHKNTKPQMFSPKKITILRSDCGEIRA